MNLKNLSQSRAGPFSSLLHSVITSAIWIRRRIALWIANADPRFEGDQLNDLHWLVRLEELQEGLADDLIRRDHYRALYVEHLGACRRHGITEWRIRIVS